jgi:hypothetical protein
VTVSGVLDQKATRCRYRAYGAELACEFELRQEAVASLWSGPAGTPLHEATVADGERLVVERGVGGDHLIRYGEHRFHLAADRTTLTCVRPRQPDARWQRGIYDWAAYAAATLAGTPCLHAAAVATGTGVLAVAGASGSGKTTLATELVGRGAAFLADDVLALDPGPVVLGQPGPPFACVDERWVAVEDPAPEPLPVAAVVVLDRDQDGPRTPELGPAGFAELRGLTVGIGGGREREERLLAALGTLAELARLLRLRAHAAVPPGALADVLLAEPEVGAAF